MIKPALVLAMFMLSVAVNAADPMKPPGWGAPVPVMDESPAPALALQQIRLRGTEASAVINNQLVHTGDPVEGARVVSIQPQRVTLKIRKKLVELSLLKPVKH